MNTITWKPGTRLDLDHLFDELRQKHYEDQSHRLWKNYHRDAFKNVLALTICFDDEGTPEMCSSILERDCWPKGAFRVLNRLWKCNNKILYPRVMSPSWGLSAQSQFKWMQENVQYKLCFISRQSVKWKKFTQEEFARQFNIHWKTDNYQYLTCPNEQDESCWQSILYLGNDDLLTNWRRR
jgi:hypothetical protein